MCYKGDVNSAATFSYVSTLRRYVIDCWVLPRKPPKLICGSQSSKYYYS